MALTAVTLVPTPGSVTQTALALAIIAIVVGTPSMAVWALFGVGVARLFRRAAVRRAINWTLAALLIATIPFMFR